MDLVKITHFNLLNTGGAYIAARRLVAAQQENGIDATLQTQKDLSLSEKARSRVFSRLDYELNNLIAPPLTISYFSGLKELNYKSILNLHWLPGPLPRAVSRFGTSQSIVWTMHDTNPFTAICHNPFECAGFKEICANCPQKGFIPNTLIERRLRQKKRSISGRESLQIVAPSRWIANMASISGVLENTPIHVIPNPVPLDVFSPIQRNQARKHLGIEEFFVIGFLSPTLGEAKGGRRAKEIFQKYSKSNSNQVMGIEIGSEKTTLQSNLMGISAKTEEEMSTVLSSCDVLIYTSTAENLPNLLLEAQACGTPIVTINVGGASECIINGKSGYIFKEDEEALIEINNLYENLQYRSQTAINAREFATRNFSPKIISDKYLEVYKSVGEGITKG